MKNKSIIIPGIFMIIAFALFVVFNNISKKTADWEFIQKVGGIKTETPLETEDGFYLPVICNVSGKDSVTIRPTQINSALVCKKIIANVIDNKIFLTVILGAVKLNKDNCCCKSVNIGDLRTGDYYIYYKDNSSTKHKIGQFTLK